MSFLGVSYGERSRRLTRRDATRSSRCGRATGAWQSSRGHVEMMTSLSCCVAWKKPK
ncbi:hypothetical protein IG631_00501 [Alternaria alternata]|nr:hypothetical protein IG631_00501 [Alternaria alternata]